LPGRLDSSTGSRQRRRRRLRTAHVLLRWRVISATNSCSFALSSTRALSLPEPRVCVPSRPHTRTHKMWTVSCRFAYDCLTSSYRSAIIDSSANVASVRRITRRFDKERLNADPLYINDSNGHRGNLHSSANTKTRGSGLWWLFLASFFFITQLSV